MPTLAKLDHEDYAHAPEDLPVIQIDMVEDPDADEQWIVTKPQPSADEDVADGGDADAHAEEGDEEEDVSEDELDEEGFAVCQAYLFRIIETALTLHLT